MVDELILIIDNNKARSLFIVIEKQEHRDCRLKMLVIVTFGSSF